MFDYTEISGDGHLVAIKRKRRIIVIDMIQDDGSWKLIEFEYSPNEYLFSALYDDTPGTKVHVNGTYYPRKQYSPESYTLDQIASHSYEYDPVHRRLHRLEQRIKELENRT